MERPCQCHVLKAMYCNCHALQVPGTASATAASATYRKCHVPRFLSEGGCGGGPGRAGSCELMIGCVAKAEEEELRPNLEEMAEVRWVSKPDLLKAIAAAGDPRNPLLSALLYIIHPVLYIE